MKRDGTLMVIAGASRTGKTTSASRIAAPASHLLVFDPKGHWATRERCRAARSCAELARAVLTAGAAPMRLAFVHHERAAFSYWAELALEYARDLERRGVAPPTLIAEETSAVTHAGKAPRGWHRLLSMGLEYGPTIVAITQRPAETDSTSFGNASLLRVFRLSRRGDRATMAEELDIDPAELRDLEPLHYVERDLRTGETRRGSLK